jgi:hypothetical protein
MLNNLFLSFLRFGTTFAEGLNVTLSSLDDSSYIPLLIIFLSNVIPFFPSLIGMIEAKAYLMLIKFDFVSEGENLFYTRVLSRVP